MEHVGIYAILLVGVVLGASFGAVLGLYHSDPANLAAFGGGFGLVTAYALWFLVDKGEHMVH